MNDQERSAAREALSQVLQLQPNHWFHRDTLESMHAVLTKHEADVRKRIADEMRDVPNPMGSRALAEAWQAARKAMLAIVAPEPKPVLCKNCGYHIEKTPGIGWTHLSSRAVTCPMRAEPAEEAAR